MHPNKLVLLALLFASSLATSRASALEPKQVEGRLFQLVDVTGRTLAKAVRLLPKGTISGLPSRYAHRWALEDAIVVFIGRDKRPTCRFARVRRFKGKLGMIGTPLLAREKHDWLLKEPGYVDPPAKKPRRVTREQVMSRTFVFSVHRGKRLSKRVRLGPKGKIIGYKASSAQRWDLVDGKVVFYDHLGRVSVTFTAIRFFKSKLELMGNDLRDKRKVSLVLREPGFGK